MNKKYTYEILAPLCADSHSLSEVIHKLGLSPGGGTQANLKARIQEFNIDISHFTGQKWRKNVFNYDWMKKGVPYHSNYRYSLIALRGRKCEQCGLTTWLNQEIPLEVHHIDQDKTNNDPTNLQLLCPNCHALTNGFRNRK